MLPVLNHYINGTIQTCGTYVYKCTYIHLSIIDLFTYFVCIIHMCLSFYIITICLLGFSGSSASKESACNAGDPGSIPGMGRPPGEGLGYPLQYSWVSMVA